MKKLIVTPERIRPRRRDGSNADIARQIGKLDEDQLDPIENRVLDFASHDVKTATRVYFEE